MILYILMFAAFLTMFFFVLGVYNLLFSSRLKVLQRLDLSMNDNATLDNNSKNKNVKNELLGFMGALGGLFSRRSYMASIQKTLNQASILMRAEEFLGIALASLLGSFVVFYLLTGLLPVAVIGAFIGFKMPSILVNIKKKKRVKQLNNQLPEALKVISNGLRAGFSFTQAMSVVSRELDAPISEEFNRIIRENSLGKPLEEVLMNFLERTDDNDIDMFITALLIQRQVGGNLAEVLDNISHTIRDRIKIQGEIKTLTAQGRLSAFIIGALPFVLALVISLINPGYMQVLIQETMGLVLIGVALFSMLIGIFLLQKIVNVEV